MASTSITALKRAATGLSWFYRRVDCFCGREDGYLEGGFGQRIAGFYGDSDMKVKTYGLKKYFYDRYDVDEVLRENRLTAEQIAVDAAELLK